tara:strand:+ start:1288 stop:2067 length:780 start_codon:yes stop_codon:yes gene_type:complete
MGGLQEPCGYCKKEEIIVHNLFSISALSCILMAIFAVSSFVKEKCLKKKYPKFFKITLCIDFLFFIIILLIYIYDRNKRYIVCEEFHNCHGGENNTLFAESYLFSTKDSSCMGLSPLIDSFSVRNNGDELCENTPYGCCYISSQCDSCMKDTTPWTYTEYINFQNTYRERGIEHFSSINTNIVMDDKNGTNCPQMKDVIIDYLTLEKESNNNYFIIVYFIYVIVNVIQFIYLYFNPEKFNMQYGKMDNEQDGQKLRASA